MPAQGDPDSISGHDSSPQLEERDEQTNNLPSRPQEARAATDNTDAPPVDEQDRAEQNTALTSLPGPVEGGVTSNVSDNAWFGHADHCPKSELNIHLMDFPRTTHGFDCPYCQHHVEEVNENHEEACLCRACVKKKLNEIEKQPNGDLISYALRYLDVNGKFISEEPWPMPFELDKARIVPGGVIQSKRDIAFSVTTTLNVSIDSMTQAWQINPSRRGILQQSDLDVGVGNTILTIESKALVRILRDTVNYYPGVRLWNEKIEIMEPFCLLAHHMEDLEKTRDDLAAADSGSSDNSAETGDRPYVSPSEVAAESHRHLSKLLDYVTDYYGDRIEKERERHTDGLCTFDMLWYLYKPGATVYVREQGRLRGYVIKEVSAEADVLSKTPGSCVEYRLTLWYLDFDGTFVGRCVQSVFIPRFDGEREITSLKAIPADFQDRKDGGAMRDQLVTNGKTWFKYLLSGQVYYSGKLSATFDREFYGHVITDSASFWENNPEETGSRPRLGQLDEDESRKIGDNNQMITGLYCPVCSSAMQNRELPSHTSWNSPWDEYDWIDPLETKSLELESATQKLGKDHRYMLCPVGLWGLVLKTRRWEWLDVSCCKDAKVNRGAIDNLVLQDSRTMRILKALAHKYSNVDKVEGNKPRLQTWGADFIENKGEGQIFLLHGSPGVGKTYILECIAEHTGRPLLSLTAGDLGVDAINMENNLSKWFNLGVKWGAVMLIDEADVFLEKRETTDIERNSLVSVFLRCLEYYRGILFLTTNRVGHFDGAFISRIHVVVHYPKHGPEQRRRIWEMFFNKLKKDRPEILVMPQAKKYVLGSHGRSSGMLEAEWNGREIRNAFQTAVALAQYRFVTEADQEEDARITLDVEDFEDVCELTGEFKRYLKKTQGGTVESMAQQEKARNEVDIDD